MTISLAFLAPSLVKAAAMVDCRAESVSPVSSMHRSHGRVSNRCWARALTSFRKAAHLISRIIACSAVRVLPAPPRSPAQFRLPGAVGIVFDFPKNFNGIGNTWIARHFDPFDRPKPSVDGQGKSGVGRPNVAQQHDLSGSDHRLPTQLGSDTPAHLTRRTLGSAASMKDRPQSKGGVNGTANCR